MSDDPGEDGQPPPSRRRGKPSGIPEALIELPSDPRDLVHRTLDIIEICRSDAGSRAAYYRQLATIVETGRDDGSKSLLNMLYSMCDRLSSHLFSPAGIRFTLDFEEEYTEDVLARGKIAARCVGRSWERTNTDIVFADGVFEAVKYGACFLKQWVRQEGPDKTPAYQSSLVMPWQFGVYRPDSDVLDGQPAMVETIQLSMPEVWRRIWHLPNARGLYDRIKQHAAPGDSDGLSNSFFHQVLATAPLQTGTVGSQRPTPGGIVQLSTDPNFSGIGPSSVAPMVRMHEVWVWDRQDYTTIQLIEPDIIIAPLYKRCNLLVPGDLHTGLHPYTLIQPNRTKGNIWGRSELADLVEPQKFLSTTASDIKRMFGLQVDKLLFFSGSDGLNDETYDAARAAGYGNLGPGGSVADMTPKFPPEALPLLDKIIQLMEMIGGFDNLLSGRGETGVRSGVQSNPLMRAAGARLRDRSLIVERQCSAAADLTLSIMEAKDGRRKWTDAKRPVETGFLLSDLPDDRRVVVDGHTTSPIFADDHANLLFNGLKLGIVDKTTAVEELPFQRPDVIISRAKEAAEREAAVIEQLKQTNPEEWAKLLEKSAGKKR